MPIFARTPEACFKAFVEHLNPLVQSILPIQVPFEAAISKETTAILGFRGSNTIPLSTRDHGKVHVHISQFLECTADKKRSSNERYKLGTRKYWYRIQKEPGRADAIVRWEYVSPAHAEYAGKRHCWRHLQMPHHLPMPTGVLDLDKAHLPTGYVFIEEVIRFLIVDLGVRPRNAHWHDTLVASERDFWQKFNSR